MSVTGEILRLHGYPVSNYFNIARAALIEKGAVFEIVTARARQDEDFLAMNPMGKIPFLETPRGCLAETVAILEFVEEAVDGPRLWPEDPFVRARGRQIVNVVQLYVEAQIRSLFPGVFFGGVNSAATIESARAMLDRSTAALNRLSTPGPYLLGGSLSLADIFAFYCLDIADRVTRFVYGRPILDEIEGFDEWFGLMSERKSSRIVLEDFESTFALYLVEKGAAYRPDPVARPRIQGGAPAVTKIVKAGNA